VVFTLELSKLSNSRVVVDYWLGRNLWLIKRETKSQEDFQLHNPAGEFVHNYSYALVETVHSLSRGSGA
jgi:hypothetical protein